MPKDLSGAQVGMAPQNNVNNPRPAIRTGYNEFPQTYMHLTTERYGEYSPSFWAKCERGDVQNLHPRHDLHTFTLKSPMVSNVDMTKSFIKIPMQAIYPRNWEKMMTIPTQGDDVPADTRALLDISELMVNLFDSITTSSGQQLVKSLLLLELITSHGSLFEKFNMHLNFEFRFDGKNYDPDEFFDSVFWPAVIEFGKTHPIIQEPSYIQYLVSENGSYVISMEDGRYAVSPHRFIEMIRRNDFIFENQWEDFDIPNIELFSITKSYSSDSTSTDPFERCLNIEPIISYQLACAQFGSNDFVDYIYSAQLYRDNMQSLYDKVTGPFPSFLYNGITFLYDVFSAKVFRDLFINFYNIDALDYFINLFSYVPSLRYGDYFTSGKPRPLAVGEYSAQVVDNSVSAIDITRSIQMQRLLNRVNMVGRKLGDYLAGIFGGRIPEAPKDVPVFLAHQRFSIDGFETNNTGSEQLDPSVENTITTHLRATDNKLAFEIEVDEPCYIICLVSYDSMRIYSRTMDRFAFHHDRYDDFIPEMQYIGDQDIKRVELDSLEPSEIPFGYALRYMEYKQRYSYASGGFIKKLPSWAFITDNLDGNMPDRFINPDYIRSSPSEFNRFYKSLNGYSLGSFFHFIVAHMNITSPLRKMEYTPEILK